MCWSEETVYVINDSSSFILGIVTVKAPCRSCLLYHISRDMGFTKMWYVRPAKAQTSLRISAVCSEHLLAAWTLNDCLATD